MSLRSRSTELMASWVQENLDAGLLRGVGSKLNSGDGDLVQNLSVEDEFLKERKID